MRETQTHLFTPLRNRIINLREITTQFPNRFQHRSSIRRIQFPPTLPIQFLYRHFIRMSRYTCLSGVGGIGGVVEEIDGGGYAELGGGHGADGVEVGFGFFLEGEGFFFEAV